MRIIAVVGSKNPTKIESARLGLSEMFPGVDLAVSGVQVSKHETWPIPSQADSGVRDQPMSDEEAITGATNRAKAAIASSDSADYGVGMEGTLMQIGSRWFECGWMAVVDKSGAIGLGATARFEMPRSLAREVLGGEELGTVMNRLMKREDISTTGGAMGVLTNGRLTRTRAYTHGMLFALAPFVSKEIYSRD